jgi:uncharacterized protein (UPF0332 family)
MEEATVLAGTGHWSGCTNRLYYACFYAVSSLLLAHEYSTKKHSGVRSLFNRNFIKPQLLPTELGDLYSDLFDTRLENDYENDPEMQPERIQLWLEQVPRFIEQVEFLAREKLAAED